MGKCAVARYWKWKVQLFKMEKVAGVQSISRLRWGNNMVGQTKSAGRGKGGKKPNRAQAGALRNKKSQEGKCNGSREEKGLRLEMTQTNSGGRQKRCGWDFAESAQRIKSPARFRTADWEAEGKKAEGH